MAVQMKWPATCKTITQHFGHKSDRYVSGAHTGLDLGCMVGSPIFAATDGTVTVAGWMGAYGNTVRIKYNDTMTTGYHHMSRIAVKVGDNVSAGKVIGYIGSTGNSTGPHLHFEVLINGKAVDPEPYLSGASVVPASDTNATQAGLMDFPGAILKAFETLTDPIMWMRIGMVILGAVLLGITLVGMAKAKAIGGKALGAVKGVVKNG